MPRNKSPSAGTVLGTLRGVARTLPNDVELELIRLFLYWPKLAEAVISQADQLPRAQYVAVLKFVDATEHVLLEPQLDL